MTPGSRCRDGPMAAAHAAAWRTLEPGPRCGGGERADRASARGGTPRPRDDRPRRGARRSRVEVVSICTPTDSHVRLALRALDAGKHVLLEKPVASTAEEGEALLRRAAAGPARDGGARRPLLPRVCRGARPRAARRPRRGDEVRAARPARIPTGRLAAGRGPVGRAAVDLAVHDSTSAPAARPGGAGDSDPVRRGRRGRRGARRRRPRHRPGGLGPPASIGPSRPTSRCRATAAGALRVPRRSAFTERAAGRDPLLAHRSSRWIRAIRTQPRSPTSSPTCVKARHPCTGPVLRARGPATRARSTGVVLTGGRSSCPLSAPDGQAPMCSSSAAVNASGASRCGEWPQSGTSSSVTRPPAAW